MALDDLKQQILLEVQANVSGAQSGFKALADSAVGDLQKLADMQKVFNTALKDFVAQEGEAANQLKAAKTASDAAADSYTAQSKAISEQAKALTALADGLSAAKTKVTELDTAYQTYANNAKKTQESLALAETTANDKIDQQNAKLKLLSITITDQAKKLDDLKAKAANNPSGISSGSGGTTTNDADAIAKQEALVEKLNADYNVLQNTVAKYQNDATSAQEALNKLQSDGAEKQQQYLLNTVAAQDKVTEAEKAYVTAANKSMETIEGQIALRQALAAEQQKTATAASTEAKAAELAQQQVKQGSQEYLDLETKKQAAIKQSAQAQAQADAQQAQADALQKTRDQALLVEQLRAEAQIVAAVQKVTDAKKAQAAITDQGQPALDLAQQQADAITKGREKIRKALSDAVQVALIAVAAVVASTVAGPLGFVAVMVAGILTSAAAFTGLGKTIGGWILSGINGISSTIGGVFTSIGNTIGAIFAPIANVLGGIVDGIKAIGSSFTGMLGTLGAVGNQVGQIAGQFVSMAEKTGEAALAIRNLAADTGTTQEQASKLSAVFAVLGGSEYTVGTALDELLRKAGDNDGAFTRLGVATRDLNGDLLSGPTILQNLANSYQTAANKADFLANASALFSPRFITALLPIISLGPQFQQVQQDMQDLGLTMDQTMINRGVQSKASLGLLQQALGQVQNAIVAGLTPALVDFTQLVLTKLPQALEMVGKLAAQVANFIQGMLAPLLGNGASSQVKEVIDALVLKPNTGDQTITTKGAQADATAQLTDAQKALGLATKGATDYTAEQAATIQQLTGFDIAALAPLRGMEEEYQTLGKTITSVKQGFEDQKAAVQETLNAEQAALKGVQQDYTEAKQAQQALIDGFTNEKQGWQDLENAALLPLQTELDGINSALAAIRATQEGLLAPLEAQLAPLTEKLDALREKLREALQPLQENLAKDEDKKADLQSTIDNLTDPITQARDVATAALDAIRTQESAATQAIQAKVDLDKTILTGLQQAEQDALAPYKQKADEIRAQIDSIKLAEQAALAPFTEMQSKLQDQISAVQGQIDDVTSSQDDQTASGTTGSSTGPDPAAIAAAQQSAAARNAAAASALASAQAAAASEASNYASATATLASAQAALTAIDISQAQALRNLAGQQQTQLDLLSQTEDQIKATSKAQQDSTKIQDLMGSSQVGALQAQKNALALQDTLGARTAGETPAQYQERIQKAQLDFQLTQAQNQRDIETLRGSAAADIQVAGIETQKAVLQAAIKVNTDAATAIETAYKSAQDAVTKATSDVASALDAQNKALATVSKAQADAAKDAVTGQDEIQKAMAKTTTVVNAQEKAVTDAEKKKKAALDATLKSLEAQQKALNVQVKQTDAPFQAQLKPLNAQDLSNQQSQAAIKAQYDPQIAAAQHAYDQANNALKAIQNSFQPQINLYTGIIGAYDARLASIQAQYAPQVDALDARVRGDQDAIRGVNEAYTDQINSLQDQIANLQGQEQAINDAANSASSAYDVRKQQLTSGIDAIKQTYDPIIKGFDTQIQAAQRQLQLIDQHYQPIIDGMNRQVSATQGILDNITNAENSAVAPLQKRYDALGLSIDDLKQKAQDAGTALQDAVDLSKAGPKALTGANDLGTQMGQALADSFTKGLTEGGGLNNNPLLATNGFTPLAGTDVSQGGPSGGGFNLGKSIVSTIVDAIQHPETAWSKVFEPLLTDLKNGLGDAFSALGTLITSPRPKNNEQAYTSNDPSNPFAGQMAPPEKLDPSLLDQWKKIGGQIGDGIAEGMKSAFAIHIDWTNWAPFSDIPGWIQKFTTKIDPFFAQLGKDLIQGIINGMVFVWHLVTDWIGDSVKAFLRLWDDFFERHSPSKVMEKLGEDIIQGLFDGITAIWKDVLGWLGKVKDLFITGIEADVDFAKWLFEQGKAILSGALDGLKDFWTSDVEKWLGGFKAILLIALKGDTDFAKWLFDQGIKILTGVLDGLKDFWTSDLEKWLKGFLDLVVTALESTAKFAKWLYDHGKDILGGLLQGLQDVFDGTDEKGVTGWFKALPEHIKDFFSGATGAISWLVDAGGDIVGGLVNGITKAAGSVGTALHGMLTEAWKAFASTGNSFIDGAVGFVKDIAVGSDGKGGLNWLTSKFGIDLSKDLDFDAEKDPLNPNKLPGFAAGSAGVGHGHKGFTAAVVGELGPEVALLPNGTGIVPNHVVQSAGGFRDFMGGGKGLPHFAGGGILGGAGDFFGSLGNDLGDFFGGINFGDPADLAKRAGGVVDTLSGLPEDATKKLKDLVTKGAGALVGAALDKVKLPDLGGLLGSDVPQHIIATLIGHAGDFMDFITKNGTKPSAPGAAFSGKVTPAEAWDGTAGGAYGVVIDWAKKNGGQNWQYLAFELLAMAYGESGANPFADNPDPERGHDVGMFQLNDLAHPDAVAPGAFDPNVTLRDMASYYLTAWPLVAGEGAGLLHDPAALAQFWAKANVAEYTYWGPNGEHPGVLQLVNQGMLDWAASVMHAAGVEGFASGGIAGLNGPQLAMVGERGPEMILPATVTAALRGAPGLTGRVGGYGSVGAANVRLPSAPGRGPTVLNQTMVVQQQQRTRGQELAMFRDAAMYAQTEAELRRGGV